jgi:acetyl-CoA C-acetyltransferase
LWGVITPLVLRDVVIAGAGMTRFGQSPGGIVDLLAEASLAALGNAGLGVRDLDGVIVGNMSAGELCGEGAIASALVDRLGALPIPAWRVENGPASGGAALRTGVLALLAGLHRCILVVGGEKMTHQTGPEVTAAVASILHPQAERPTGVTLPSMAALLARLYLDRYGVEMTDITRVAVKNHAHGALNPYAHFQKTITLEKAMASAIVAAPLRLFDCCPRSDGAAAVVLMREDLYHEKCRQPRRTVYIRGVGQATDLQVLAERPDPLRLTAVELAASQAFEMAGITPRDVSVAELHDAFTILEVVESEAVGFFALGQGTAAVRDGVTQLGGDLPINLSGGLKAKGHPWGATGVAQACELTWQLRGEAGERQCCGGTPRYGFSMNFGGFGNNIVALAYEGGDD